MDPRSAETGGARFPANGTEWFRFFAVAVQLLLAAWVVERFQIESRGFARLFWLAVGGAVVQSLLPVRYRLTFFVALSFAGLAAVLGPRPAAWVAGLGLSLIALCHLPLSARAKLVLVVLAGAGFAALRADLWTAPWPSAIWPVLGSMFMFRLINYVYDIRHGVKPRSVWETLAYFFLLPNVCAPLFPVVDFATFRKSYYAEDAWQCSQTGLRWIARGFVQLLLYRFIYYEGVIAPAEVSGAGDIFRYVVATLGLYLRVSGIFHVVIGMVRLFGFGLPETHCLWVLSSSVNDFWRRANIYWKDFMLKLFYMPLFFKLRRQGETRAFVISTIVVVVCTWALHSYQWFWLRGTFPVKWQDGFFWTVLGLCMVANTLMEKRGGRARGRRATTKTLREWPSRCWRTVATFVFIAVLWSLWTCESLTDWFGMWGTIGADNPPLTSPTAAWTLVAVVAGVLVIGSGFGHLLTDSGLAGRSQGAFVRGALVTVLTLVGLLALSAPPVYTRLGDEASRVVQSLRIQKLNRADAQRLQRGYYEDLLDVEQFNSDLWHAMANKPQGWGEWHETAAMRPTTDFLLTELIPSKATPYHGATLRTNQLGLRDREYEPTKPPGTWRAAVLGASITMGSGVENDQTFENLVEDKLNAEGNKRYELLNFSVGGYSALQRAWALEHKGVPLGLDAAFYIAHENEEERLATHLSAARGRKLALPYPELQAIYAEAGIEDGMPGELFNTRLRPHLRRILTFAIQRMGAICKANGIRPVWVFLPTLELAGTVQDLAWLDQIARDAGFDLVSLFDVYRGHDVVSIRVADWDYHPNASGHGIIADRWLRELRERPELLQAR